MSTPLVPSITDEQLADIESQCEKFAGFAVNSSLVEQLITRLRAAESDARRYRLLRDGSGWPAVFASHDAPEPLRGADLDTTMERPDA